jgi:hypothetical protein
MPLAQLDGFDVIAEPCVPDSGEPPVTFLVPAVSQNGTVDHAPDEPRNGSIGVPLSPARAALAKVNAQHRGFLPFTRARLGVSALPSAFQRAAVSASI